MKLNFFKTIIALAISLLIAYGFYSFNNGENKLILSIGSFVLHAIALINTIGVNYDQSSTTTNVRVVSGIYFFITFFCSLFFLFISFSTPTYVIINGIILLIYTLIFYGINQANQ